MECKTLKLIEAELNDICQGVGREENEEEMVTEYMSVYLSPNSLNYTH